MSTNNKTSFYWHGFLAWVKLPPGLGMIDEVGKIYRLLVDLQRKT